MAHRKIQNPHWENTSNTTSAANQLWLHRFLRSKPSRCFIATEPVIFYKPPLLQQGTPLGLPSSSPEKNNAETPIPSVKKTIPAAQSPNLHLRRWKLPPLEAAATARFCRCSRNFTPTELLLQFWSTIVASTSTFDNHQVFHATWINLLWNRRVQPPSQPPPLSPPKTDASLLSMEATSISATDPISLEYQSPLRSQSRRK